MIHDCLAENGVVGFGPVPCKVAGIGIAPGRTEWKVGRKPFVGPAGKLLDGTLEATNWSRDRIYLTNAYCQWEDSPTEEEMFRCSERVTQEINDCNPNLVLLFGGIVSEHFLGKGKYKRGHVYYKQLEWDSRPRYWLPTYHPAAFLHRDNDSGFKADIADFARDVSKIELYAYNNTAPKEPNVIVCSSADEAERILWSLKGLVAIDIESSYDGLDFAYLRDDERRELLLGNEDAKMLCFSVCGITEDEAELTSWVIPGYLISSIKKGWGSRSEVQWLMHLGLFDRARLKSLIGEELHIAEDTLLQSYSLDERGGAAEENERAVGIHGLKDLSAEFLAAPDYAIKVLKSNADDMHYYNGLDTWNTRHLQPIFLFRQQQDDVRTMYEKILIPGANALSEIQDYGVAIDKRFMFQLGKQWSSDWLEKQQALIDSAYSLGWDSADFNLNSHPQLNHFIFDILGARPDKKFGRSSRREVLEALADKDFPWVSDFQEWRSVDHLLNTYIVGVEDDIKFDGRLHPEPIMHGSRGGRLAYHKPPIQTIPKHGVNPKLAVIRKMFVAGSPDRILIEADYRQAELWATGYLAHDDNMLNALASGDAHGATAKDIFNTDESNPQWKILRELGKMFNFGTLYNRTAKGYATNMWQGRKPPTGMENIRWNIKEAQAFIDAWYAKYPNIKAWQKRVINEAVTTGENVTATGRKRRYWIADFKTVNQAVNIGPQSLAHDFLFNSLVKLHWALAEYDAHCLFEVHDSIMIEAPKRWQDEVIDLVTRIMTEPKFGIGSIPIDISVGPSWYELEKVK